MNQLTTDLFIMIARSVTDATLWQPFGYNEVPKRGAIWRKITPKKVELENYLSKEISLMATLDIMHGIKLSDLGKEQKARLSVDILQQLFSVTKAMFDKDSFIKDMRTTQESYGKLKESENINRALIYRAKSALSKESLGPFILGIAALMPDDKQRSFVLGSTFITDMVNKADYDDAFYIASETEDRKALAIVLKDIAY